MTDPSPVFCAIDKPDLEQAMKICKAVSETGIGIKLGLEFFNALGPSSLKEIEKTFPNTPIFLDLKYHDIPNTVSGAIKAVTNDFKPAFLNVHASGGREMMEAAREACPSETKLLAVTILTSINEENMIEAGYRPNVQDRVIQMAELSQQAGLEGVVCSSHEIEALRQICGKDFTLMVPGIRPEGSNSGDQKRIMTPKQAMEKGASHLVIGRPITQADDMKKAVTDILKSIEGT